MAAARATVLATALGNLEPGAAMILGQAIAAAATVVAAAAVVH